MQEQKLKNAELCDELETWKQKYELKRKEIEEVKGIIEELKKVYIPTTTTNINHQEQNLKVELNNNQNNFIDFSINNE